MNERLYQDVIDHHYAESSLSPEDIAKKHGVSLSLCLSLLRQLNDVSRHFRNFPETEPSLMAINKIKACAREHVSSRHPWWVLLPWLKLTGVFATLFVVIYSSFTISKHFFPEKDTVATKMARQLEDPLKERLFTRFFAKKFVDGPVQPLSTVSLGQTAYNFDEELDHKILTKTLSGRDVETLYFRARKLAKQGAYLEALQDYQFLSQNYADFPYGKYLPLDMAACFEGIGDKRAAIEILESYIKQHSDDNDVSLWIEQLKSVTF